MDESEHCKEVYAHHGLAMFRAQCVEQSISQLLVFFYFFRKNVPHYTTIEKWEEDIDAYDESLSAKTMGQLLKQLSSLKAVDALLEPLLREALAKRNHLAHRFFVDHALNFVSSTGRDRMISELEAATELFNKVENTLNPITLSLCEKYGLTQEKLKEIEQALFAEADGVSPAP